MLGMHVSLPIYISPAAMAKLGHPLGEVNLTRGAGECGIIQGVRTRSLLLTYIDADLQCCGGTDLG
jgi:isopentenyl diphosphate isomerase/L-lactate dehydrogenase-like FMN-dependent dehydrogenase